MNLPARRENMGIVPNNQDELERTAKMMAASGFFDDAKQAAQACVKIQAGLEMGIKPVQAMTAIHVIKGKVSIGANLVAAMLKRAGYNYKVRWHGNEAIEIVFYDPSKEELGNSTFSMEDAHQAGLLGNPTWKKFPRNMLFARAMMNGARWYAPDVALGIYDPDELQSIEPQTYPQAVEARVIPSRQSPPPIDPTNMRSAPALNPHTATIEISEDDGSYQWGRGREGTKWFEAHRALMAATSDLGIERDILKAGLGIETFKSTSASNMDDIRKRLAHTEALIKQLCSTDDIDAIGAIFQDAIDAIGVYAEFARPVQQERLIVLYREPLKQAQSLAELEKTYKEAVRSIGHAPQALVSIKDAMKAYLSQPSTEDMEAA